MMTEKFNLKWNDFHVNASKSFGLFRNESYLHDVTLVSDDFKHIPAHKLVLSACSEYFKNILQETKQSQPLICLDGVNSKDLTNVLDYVYDGEVKIHQEDLDRFMSIAIKLSLEGLIGNEEEETGEITEYVSFTPEKNETHSEQSYSNNMEKTVVLHENNTILLSDVDENISMNSDGSYSCNKCGKIITGKQGKLHIKRHMQVHVEGLSYDCTRCNKTFRTQNSLWVH